MRVIHFEAVVTHDLCDHDGERVLVRAGDRVIISVRSIDKEYVVVSPDIGLYFDSFQWPIEDIAFTAVVEILPSNIH